MFATCRAHLILLHLITLIFGEAYKWSLSLRSYLHTSVTSSLFSTQFSNTLNLCCYFRRDVKLFPHSYKRVCKIVVLCISVFMYFIGGGKTKHFEMNDNTKRNYRMRSSCFSDKSTNFCSGRKVSYSTVLTGSLTGLWNCCHVAVWTRVPSNKLGCTGEWEGEDRDNNNHSQTRPKRMCC
jgi:hypothetical protein